ncbi:MAG: hypothetical protein V4719_15650 [Planctomycetota bacterium]
MAVDEKTIQPDIMQNAQFLKQLIPILFIGGGLSVFVLIWIAGAHFARKRRQALEQLAEALGFTFIPKALPTVLVGIPQFTLLQAGRRKQIENLLCGSNGTTQVMIFDWRYVTGSGKSSRTHLSTIVAIQSQELRQPLWLCRPESVFDKIGLTFDGRDIDFEDQPLFSMKYHLHGNNEKRIRDLFDSDVCTFFAQHTGMYAEASGEWLIYCRQEKKIAPEKVRELLQDAFQLHVLLKAAPAESQPAISDQARDEMPPEAERQL